MKYGNYCGPYWSDGAYQTSVVGTLEPIDEFDETCRVHDAHYALGDDLVAADFSFFRENVGRGVLRTVAGSAVGLQGLIRWGGWKAAPNNFVLQSQEEVMKNANKAKTNLRGTAQAAPKAQRVEKTITTSMVPAAVGTTMRASKPKVVRSGNTARITGRDFICSVDVHATTVFGLSITALLSPAYFSSAFLGNLCRSYESYKWNKLRIHYVPAVSTSTPGTIVLASAHSITQPALSGESSNFLPRVMTQGNATMGPLWEHNYIDIDCERGGRRLVDPTTSTDLDDNIHEELQVYFSAASLLTAGYLFAEYDCSFFEPVYQPHAATIPIPYGPGLRCFMSEAVNTAVIGDDWCLQFDSGITLSSVPNGTLFRAVLDVSGSEVPTGTALNNLVSVATFSHTTTSAFGVTTQPLPLVGGMVMYFSVDGAQVKVHTTLESARIGNGSGQCVVRTAYTTSKGSYPFIVTMVGLDNSAITSVQ